jgi:hypothetical protein
MDRWQFQITTHSAGEVLRVREELGHPPDEGSPPVVYCDTEGVCFFDEAPNPYVDSIVHILNAQGEQGWDLVQMVPRQADFICIWKREL